MSLSADEIVERLGLKPHPEGGWFAETFRDDAPEGGRAASTAIYYLLKAGERSHWHRVRDASEVWHFYDGAPLSLGVARPDGGGAEIKVLGADIARGEAPQLVVPRDWWRSAQSLGDWTLVGCTVSPGFEFASFEMAPPGWSPGD